MWTRIIVSLLIACVGAWSAHAASIAQLIAPSQVTDIKLSPSGKYLAARVFNGNDHVLNFFDRETLKAVGGFGISGESEVGTFFWVNDERVVGKVYQVPPGKEQPLYYGELFATNYDGGRMMFLFGYRSGEPQIGSRIKKPDADRAWADIVDMLEGDDRHILISRTRWSESQGLAPDLAKLDINTGAEIDLHTRSAFGQGRFFTDRDGRARIITSLDSETRLHVQTLPTMESDWIELSGLSGTDRNFMPLVVAPDDNSFYALDNPDGDKWGLYRISLDGKAYDKIYVHANVDISDAMLTTDEKAIYALMLDDGYPSYLILSRELDEAALLKDLLQTFAGYLVSIRSRTRDGRYWIVKTGTDVDSGTFYLFDRDKRQATTLFNSRPDVEAAELSPMQPISFESFDGLTISGYFTPARNVADGKAPLVMLVHGGPAVRDYWGYDGEVQALAANGFSVLQVNYRGSAGYGSKFERLGDRHWGDDVQKDIIAGTRWALARNLAPSGKVCIMGASFGAYSAMQSAILAPDLFACVVANAGIYDLTLMYTSGDIETQYFGKAFLEQTIGTDEAELARFSPVNHVDKLKAPVFIAHGKSDKRAPYRHATRLKKALDRNHKQYEWFVKRGEAHGFYDTENELEYLESVLAFLKRHTQ